MLWQALDLAELHEHRGLMFDIWIELLSEDDSRGQHERARLWARRAEIARLRAPGQSRRRLDLAIRRGVAELRAGEVLASERILRQGLEAAEAESGVELQRAHLLDALGNTLRRAGRAKEALDAYARAETLWQTQLGPSHPHLARHDYNVGLLLTELGQVDAARRRIERANMRWAELFGPRTLLVGRAELALAQLDQSTGALDEAKPHPS